MSDFDKEAERERLREQYEREQAKREVSEKMSELLLQGATMTNAHCSECGDPIFRYEGQEFCATCEKAVDRAEDEAGEEATGEGEGADDSGEHIEVTAPSEEARVQFGGEDVGTDAADSAGETRPADAPARDDPAGAERPGGSRSRQATGAAGGEVGAVGDAHDALQRTLARFSEQAAATDDPREAEAYLAAAREAAETLAALRR